MKKYILFTNTNEKYHKYSLEFNDLCFLWEHLQKEFYFEQYSFKDILKEYFNFLKDNDVDLFEQFYSSELILISTFANDLRKSYILPLRDMNDETDFFVMALNELLSKHGEVTSPVGVVNEYEIVAVDENVEGQEEFELPF